MKISSFLRNPIVVFASMGIGVLLGMYMPALSRVLGEIGGVYFLLIRMTVIPILVSAIISSVGLFVQSPTLHKVTLYTVGALLFSMVLIIVVSLIAGLILKPGMLTPEKFQVLSEYIGTQTNVLEFNLYEDSAGTGEKEIFLIKLFSLVVPGNIFSALVRGNALALAFVSIIIGVAGGLLQVAKKQRGDQSSSVIIVFFDSVFKIFQMLVGWVVTILPFGLVCIISGQIAGLGLGLIGSVAKLIISFYILSIVILAFNCIITGITLKKSPFTIFRATMYPTLMGFTTKSSIATIPVTTKSLNNNLGVGPTFSRLFVPLSMVLARYGNIAYFSLVSVFAAQLYAVDLGIVQFMILIAVLLFSGIATAGATGFATLGIISTVFLPLGVPAETILLVLYAMDPIIDPIRTSLIVHTNACFVTIVHHRKVKPLEAAAAEEAAEAAEAAKGLTAE